MKLFLAVLLFAAWQDGRKQSISGVFLALSGAGGILWSAYSGRNVAAVCASALVGAAILLLGRITGGAAGEGDGWFFVVSGCYLALRENLFLLAFGGLLCALYSLGLVVLAFMRGRDIRKKRLPFLPFLVPAGIWLAFC